MKIALSILYIIFFLIFTVQAQDASIGDLGEIVIYGRRPADHTASYIITSEDIAATVSLNAGDALDLASGVDAGFAGKGDILAVMRGFGQQSIKVLIDGVPAYEGYMGSVDLSAVPANAISEISVIKDAPSVLYGSNTMGGVINIITRKGLGAPGAGFSFYGGPQASGYSTGLRGIHPKTAYYLGYSQSSSGGYELSRDFDPQNPWTGIASSFAENGGKRENSDYRKQSLLFNLHTGKETVAAISFILMEAERGCGIEKSRYWRFSEWQQWQASVTVDTKLAEGILVKGRLFYVDHIDELEDDIGRTAVLGGKSWFEKSRYNDYSAGFHLQSALNTGAGSWFKAGISLQEDFSRQTEFNPIGPAGNILYPGWSAAKDYRTMIFNAAAQESLYLAEAAWVSAGACYDTFMPQSSSVSGAADISDVNGQLVLGAVLNGSIELRAYLDSRTRFPRMKELYSIYTGGNPELKAERSIGTGVGLELGSGVLSGSGLRVFYYDVEDLIDLTADLSGDRSYQNSGRAYMGGAETEFVVNLGDALDIDFSYTYLEAWDASAGRRVALRPRHTFKSSTGIYFGRGLGFNFTASYSAQQVEYLSVAGDIKTRHISPYFTADAKAYLKKPAVYGSAPEIYISVKNITDENYDTGSGPLPGTNLSAGISTWF